MATIKQRIAVKKLVEISRRAKGQKNITIGRVLREAGYKDNTAIKPSQVTQSKGFQELLAEIIPDDEAAKVHDELLHSAKLSSFNFPLKTTKKDIEDVISSLPGCKLIKTIRVADKGIKCLFYAPDGNTRKSALDMFYKLKNAYPKDKSESETGQKMVEIFDRISKILPK